MSDSNLADFVRRLLSSSERSNRILRKKPSGVFRTSEDLEDRTLLSGTSPDAPTTTRISTDPVAGSGD